MRTMKGAKWTIYETAPAFDAAVPTLDTASRGTFKAHMPDGRVIESDFHAIVNNRTQRPVGAVKKGYIIEQMPELAADGLDALQNIGATFDRAELWASDARQWLGIYTKTPVQFGGDNSPYRLGFGIMNSFDGSTPVEIGGISTRVVCENTLAMARRNLEKYRHTAVGVVKRKDAIAILAGRVMDEVVELGSKLTQAREVVLEPEEAGAILKETYGDRGSKAILTLLPRYVASDEELAGRDPSATDGITRWSLYQATTDHFSHNKDLASTFRGRMSSLITANDLLV